MGIPPQCAELSHRLRRHGRIFGGDDHTPRANWYPQERVLAVPYDTPVVGWRGKRVNALRLWSARVQPSALHKLD